LKRFFVVSTTTLAVLFFFKARTKTLPPLPAPTIDRIGFPTDYQNSFLKLYTFDNFQNRQIRVIWANPTAASVTPDTVINFPYGSIIVMDTYGVLEDASGEPILDANGRFQPAAGAIPTVFVMRKEKGFGADYGLIRNGEWEYVAYRRDGTYSTPPSGTGSCAACHLTGASGTGAAPARRARLGVLGQHWVPVGFRLPPGTVCNGAFRQRQRGGSYRVPALRLRTRNDSRTAGPSGHCLQ